MNNPATGRLYQRQIHFNHRQPKVLREAAAPSLFRSGVFRTRQHNSNPFKSLESSCSNKKFFTCPLAFVGLSVTPHPNEDFFDTPGSSKIRDYFHDFEIG